MLPWPCSTKSRISRMETAFNTDFGLIRALKGKGFSKAGDFPVYLTGPGGTLFNFADSGSASSMFNRPELFFLAERFNRPVYSFYQLNNTKNTVFDILYYTPNKKKTDMSTLDTDKYFRKTEVATIRSSWTGENALFVGVKAGKNGVPHYHLDLGSFILYEGNIRWIFDPGKEKQTYQRHKHKIPREDFYRIRAEGHNTLVIGPDRTGGQDKKGETRITRFESKQNTTSLSCDLTGAYRNRAKKVIRNITIDKKKKEVLIEDLIQGAGEREVWWFAHTEADIKIGKNKREAKLKQDGRELSLSLLSPKNAQFISMKARPLPSSPNPDIQNPNRGINKLAIHGKGIDRIKVLIRSDR